MERKTYGPSVQVKTWLNPQERTSLSASLRDLVTIAAVVIRVTEGSKSSGND